ncbi:hypothetical protein C8Q79DRAFT_965307 [Trametes meyenii]|nr:hypothetical protein C8Q79DRAFT_965307 [Trametes meyenii]
MRCQSSSGNTHRSSPSGRRPQTYSTSQFPYATNSRPSRLLAAPAHPTHPITQPAHLRGWT